MLGAILGELPGWLAVGEIRNIFASRIACGCGEIVAACPFWTKVIDGAHGEFEDGIDVERFLRIQRESVTPRKVPALLRTRSGEASYVAEVTAALYRSASEVASAQVVVDGSKNPGSAAVASWDPRTFMLHLVREPRATVYSWNRRRRVGQPAMSARMATGGWCKWNLLADVVSRSLPPGRRLRLRYEDFVDDPVGTVGRLAGLVDPTLAGGLPADLLRPGRARLTTNHIIASNPSKFRTGDVPLEPDEVWRQQMPLRERTLIGSVAWPLMLRYGYVPGRTGRTARQPRTGQSERPMK